MKKKKCVRSVVDIVGSTGHEGADFKGTSEGERVPTYEGKTNEDTYIVRRSDECHIPKSNAKGGVEG